MTKKILAILDDRKSNTKQSIALANALKNVLGKAKIDKANLQFNVFSKLPNIISHGSLIVSKIHGIQKGEKYDIIISCGRKLAKAALDIKIKYGHKNTKTISILNPDMNFKSFDAVVLPYHDNVLDTEKNNIVNIYGSMCSLDKDEIQKANKDWAWLYKSFDRPYIAVMIGGSSKNFVFSKELSVKFVKSIEKIAKNMNATLFITTSRRTPEYIVEDIRNILTCSYYLYTFAINKEKNPYNAFVGSSDFFICTGDSISMISEAIENLKPVYIFRDGIENRKHNDFLDQIKSRGMIKDLLPNVNKLSSKKLLSGINDLELVAKRILEKIKM